MCLILLMCLIGDAGGSGGEGSVWHNTSVHHTLQPMAADGEKTPEEEKEEWVAKQPVVTLMEWKQTLGAENIRLIKMHPLLREITQRNKTSPH